MPSKESAPTERRAPVRRTPLDGLEPRHFATKAWPNSPLALPRQVREYGLSEEQLKNLSRAISEWRDLILDYEQFVALTRVTHAAMAGRMGVSEGTLRALRRGDQFPSFRTLAIMRGLVPDPEQLQNQSARGQFLPEDLGAGAPGGGQQARPGSGVKRSPGGRSSRR